MKITTFRFLLDIVTTEDLELIQLDVKTTSLHGNLEEEIYMEQPKGFVVAGQEHLVCQLRKSLYGLNQAPGSGIRSSMILYNQLASQRAIRTNNRQQFGSVRFGSKASNPNRFEPNR